MPGTRRRRAAHRTTRTGCSRAHASRKRLLTAFERRRCRPRIAMAAVVVLLASGCAKITTPSSRPSGAPVLGIDWGRAASVERPANYEETVSPSYAGTHPILRIQGQAQMSDVVGLSGGGFVAIGYAPPD